MQAARWPAAGRHILAHYDERSIMVYQAYRPSIARAALEQQAFQGGGFSYERMSWIKPNFLWMMFRCGWASKEGQEMVLGLRLRREFFEELLAQAALSTFYSSHYATRELWEEAKARSTVRLQWDPDHGPRGGKLLRRAIQLGLRGETLRAFGTRELLEVIDMTGFVTEQRPNSDERGYPNLRSPVEQVYIPADRALCERLGLEGFADPSQRDLSDEPES